MAWLVKYRLLSSPNRGLSWNHCHLSPITSLLVLKVGQQLLFNGASEVGGRMAPLEQLVPRNRTNFCTLACLYRLLYAHYILTFCVAFISTESYSQPGGSIRTTYHEHSGVLTARITALSHRLQRFSNGTVIQLDHAVTVSLQVRLLLHTLYCFLERYNVVNSVSFRG